MLLRWKLNDRLVKNHILTLAVVAVLVLFLRTFEAYLRSRTEGRCNKLWNEPIDVVYTWVNGSDPKFLLDLNNFIRKNLTMRTDISEQRFDDKYELKFSLRSLEKYAPWVRHVYIVTNGQIPYWLNLDYEKVTVVTHSEIFLNNDDLPTFSSPAIESHIHRINGLSRRFMYFNDDIFLGSPVYLDDFVSEAHGYSVYLAWPLPMCSPDCPWLYVHDGQCDHSCYNYNCQMDGGDCDDDVMHTQIKSITKQNSEDNDIDDINQNKDALMRKPKKLTSYDKLMNYLKLSQHFNNQTLIDANRTASKTSNNFIKLLNKTNESITDVIKYHNEKTMWLDKKWRKKQRKKYKSTRNVENIDDSATVSVDAYSASLQHTNRIMNAMYGFHQRRVPSHAPLFVDKQVMNDLQVKFSKEFQITSSNKVRSANDMQYSFSYYYFLISEQTKKTVSEIFDDFDTDMSGTWSDREIRTLLTRLYELPLSYLVVDHFESMLLNCSEYKRDQQQQQQMVSTPEYERYVDSRLPTITKDMLVQCKTLSTILLKRFGNTPKYKTELLKNTEDTHVAFKMFNSNVSDVVMHLDEIRSKPKKFVCLNDNLDESKRSDNELIKAVLYDFYLSLFPHPSKFELPSNYKNRFQYMEELQAWKQNHFVIKLTLYILIAFLLNCFLFSLCKRTVCLFINKLFY